MNLSLALLSLVLELASHYLDEKDKPRMIFHLIALAMTLVAAGLILGRFGFLMRSGPEVVFKWQPPFVFYKNAPNIMFGSPIEYITVLLTILRVIVCSTKFIRNSIGIQNEKKFLFIETFSLSTGIYEVLFHSCVKLCNKGRGTQSDHGGDALDLTQVHPVTSNGVPPWSWRETPGTGEQPGRAIQVKWCDYSRRIGIDGSTEAIKESIKSAFRLRTKGAFWLEDEHQIIRNIDRNMPVGNYTLYIDEGITVKICIYGGPDRVIIRTEEKTFYSDAHFHEYLARSGLTGLRELGNGFRNIDDLDDLRPGGAYQGVRKID